MFNFNKKIIAISIFIFSIIISFPFQDVSASSYTECLQQGGTDSSCAGLKKNYGEITSQGECLQEGYGENLCAHLSSGTGSSTDSTASYGSFGSTGMLAGNIDNGGLECLWPGDVFCGIKIFAINTISGIAQAIIGFSSDFLNNIISKKVFGDLGYSTADNYIIKEGWEIVRNVANAALVLGLIIIAITIILGREDKAKKTLINFIIIALLINFTPVICSFIIEGFDLITKSFLTGGVSGAGYAQGISSAFSNIRAEKDFPIQIFYSVILLLFSLAFSAVLLFYSILFLARTIILWILVIFSPVAFATKVFPQFKAIKQIFPSILHWDDWWDSFWQWCVIGIPAGLSIYLANMMLTNLINNSTVVNSTALSTGSGGILTFLIAYTLPFAFLLVGFFISISAGGQVGGKINEIASGAWAKTGGKALGVTGAWAKDRAGAAGTWVKEGTVGRIGGSLSNLVGNEKIDTSTIEGRELGRQAWAGWKKRAVQDTPLRYLTNPPALEKDKDAALENYSKNWSRYSFDDRQKMEKMLIEKDATSFVKGAIDKDKTNEENSRELQRRLSTVSVNGGDKAKLDTYLVASGNTKYMGPTGLAAVNKWASDSKIDDIGKKIRSMSAKDAREKIGADAIKQNPDILKNMGAKMTVSIMQQGSEEQRNAMKEMTIGNNNNDFVQYITDQGAIFRNQNSSPEEKEAARINVERALKVANEVSKNS